MIIDEIGLPKQSRPIEYEIKNSCWECISHVQHSRKRYVKIRRGGKKVFLHRHIYRLFVGPIPDDMVIRHKCDNPKCINPEHLEIGFVADNNKDARDRGRHRSGRPTGVSNGRHKLTEQQVLEIRNNSLSIRKLAKQYGISSCTVHSIKNKKLWKHI